MEENKLYRFICDKLLNQFAYSLEIADDADGNKQLMVKFRNCNNIEQLTQECNNEGIPIKCGSLAAKIDEVKKDLELVSMMFYRLDISLSEDCFFIGECLQLKLYSRALVEITKVEKRRWWVMRATDEMYYLKGKFVNIKGCIGPASVINIEGNLLNIESSSFFIPNKTSMIANGVICPTFYNNQLDGTSLEEILIIPAYKMGLSLFAQGHIDFSEWRIYIQNAQKHALDVSTSWHIANAVINNYDNLYK